MAYYLDREYWTVLRTLPTGRLEWRVSGTWQPVDEPTFVGAVDVVEGERAATLLAASYIQSDVKADFEPAKVRFKMQLERPHAPTVRKDAGPIQEAGPERSGGQAEGGENLQRQAQAGSTPGDAQEAPVSPPKRKRGRPKGSRNKPRVKPVEQPAEPAEV